MAKACASFFGFLLVLIILRISETSTAGNVEQCENGGPVFNPGGCSGCSNRCLLQYKKDFLGSYCHTNLEGVTSCLCCIPYPPDAGYSEMVSTASQILPSAESVAAANRVTNRKQLKVYP